MQSQPFSVEISLDARGVRSVRILGENWDQSAQAHALLQKLSPIIQELDAETKRRARVLEMEDDINVVQ